MVHGPSDWRRRSIRLRDYDYSNPGAYFLTICTYGREFLFGDIVDGEMTLNASGEIVRDEWVKSAQIRAEIVLDEFVVMPNHVHGIVIITDDPQRPPPTLPPKSNMERPAIGPQSADGPKPMAGIPGRPPRSLASFVAGFKSAPTRRINLRRQSLPASIWQRNYYEHIVRSQVDIDRLRRYIAENPLQWAADQENPSRE